jgi:hypothetical protein
VRGLLRQALREQERLIGAKREAAVHASE